MMYTRSVELGSYLQHVAPVQHEVSIRSMRAQVGCVANQEAEVGLQELVAIIGLYTGASPPSAPAPATAKQPACTPLKCAKSMKPPPNVLELRLVVHYTSSAPWCLSVGAYLNLVCKLF